MASLGDRAHPTTRQGSHGGGGADSFFASVLRSAAEKGTWSSTALAGSSFEVAAAEERPTIEGPPTQPDRLVRTSTSLVAREFNTLSDALIHFESNLQLPGVEVEGVGADVNRAGAVLPEKKMASSKDAAASSRPGAPDNDESGAGGRFVASGQAVAATFAGISGACGESVQPRVHRTTSEKARRRQRSRMHTDDDQQTVRSTATSASASSSRVSTTTPPAARSRKISLRREGLGPRGGGGSGTSVSGSRTGAPTTLVRTSSASSRGTNTSRSAAPGVTSSPLRVAEPLGAGVGLLDLGARTFAHASRSRRRGGRAKGGAGQPTSEGAATFASWGAAALKRAAAGGGRRAPYPLGEPFPTADAAATHSDAVAAPPQLMRSRPRPPADHPPPLDRTLARPPANGPLSARQSAALHRAAMLNDPPMPALPAKRSAARCAADQETLHRGVAVDKRTLERPAAAVDVQTTADMELVVEDPVDGGSSNGDRERLGFSSSDPLTIPSAAPAISSTLTTQLAKDTSLDASARPVRSSSRLSSARSATLGMPASSEALCPSPGLLGMGDRVSSVASSSHLSGTTSYLLTATLVAQTAASSSGGEAPAVVAGAFSPTAGCDFVAVRGISNRPWPPREVAAAKAAAKAAATAAATASKVSGGRADLETLSPSPLSAPRAPAKPLTVHGTRPTISRDYPRACDAKQSPALEPSAVHKAYPLTSGSTAAHDNKDMCDEATAQLNPRRSRSWTMGTGRREQRQGKGGPSRISRSRSPTKGRALLYGHNGTAAATTQPRSGRGGRDRQAVDSRGGKPSAHHTGVSSRHAATSTWAAVPTLQLPPSDSLVTHAPDRTGASDSGGGAVGAVSGGRRIVGSALRRGEGGLVERLPVLHEAGGTREGGCPPRSTTGSGGGGNHDHSCHEHASRPAGRPTRPLSNPVRQAAPRSASAGLQSSPRQNRHALPAGRQHEAAAPRHDSGSGGRQRRRQRWTSDALEPMPALRPGRGDAGATGGMGTVSGGCGIAAGAIPAGRRASPAPGDVRPRQQRSGSHGAGGYSSIRTAPYSAHAQPRAHDRACEEVRVPRGRHPHQSVPSTAALAAGAGGSEGSAVPAVPVGGVASPARGYSICRERPPPTSSDGVSLRHLRRFVGPFPSATPSASARRTSAGSGSGRPAKAGNSGRPTKVGGSGTKPGVAGGGKADKGGRGGGLGGGFFRGLFHRRRA